MTRWPEMPADVAPVPGQMKGEMMQKYVHAPTGMWPVTSAYDVSPVASSYEAGWYKADEVETTIAALKAERDAAVARAERAEADRRMIVSHATMGGTDGQEMGLNEICVRITAVRNEIYQEGKARAALPEAKGEK